MTPPLPGLVDAAGQTDQERGPGHCLRVLVVETHDLVQWGLRLLLTQQTWVERCVAARDRGEAIEHAQRYSPHVALVDVLVGRESGALLAQRLRRLCPAMRIIFLAEDAGMSERALRAAGACGVVSKLSSAESILNAVRLVGDGRTLFNSGETAQPERTLSPREEQVLRLIAVGATNPEIARSLHLSPHTVKQHACSLYRKLGVRNRTAAAQEAQRIGYVA
jgi:DNA-binding NarL/FixJ family response regulator